MTPDLARRLAAHGLTLTAGELTTYGYTAHWRLDGLGAPAWFARLEQVEAWASEHLRDTTAQDNDMTTTTLIGDNREHLQTLPDRSVHLVVTSPPYFGLRAYGDDAREIGREPTPDAYIAALVDVFRQVRRVLRDDGVLVLNLGDSYSGSGKGGQSDEKRSANWQPAYTNKGYTPDGIPPKSKLLIPHRVALALQADGWIVRQDFAWLKRNVMPESVTDRPTTAHEYLFLLAKSARYFWDADAVRQEASNTSGWAKQREKGINTWDYGRAGYEQSRVGGMSGKETFENPAGRNYRTTDTFFASLDSAIADARAHLAYLETIRERGGLMLDEGGDPLALLVNPKPYKESHFAVFPPDLVEPFIRAGSPQQCCPTCGAGWVRQVEREAGTYNTLEGQRQQIRANGAQTGGTDRVTLGVTDKIRRIDRGFAPGCACPNNDGSGRAVVLDPFGGSGTVGMVAERLGRDAVLIELHATYAPLQDKRLNGVQVEMPLDAA